MTQPIYTTVELLTEARRILAATPGTAPLCTWVASVADQRKAAQRALDGDTADLEYYISQDDAELWQQPEWFRDAFIANWQPTASESTVPGAAA